MYHVSIQSNGTVINAQNSVAKVGDKLAKGLYQTARGAKSAYTQTMNKMANAIFDAASDYSIKAIKTSLTYYGVLNAGNKLLDKVFGF